MDKALQRLVSVIGRQLASRVVLSSCHGSKIHTLNFTAPTSCSTLPGSSIKSISHCGKNSVFRKLRLFNELNKKYRRHFVSILPRSALMSANLSALKLQFYSRRANPLEESITVKFVRSSGPGGQNTNKVNTKAEIRLCVAQADWLSKDVREKLELQQKNRINKDGEIIVFSDKHRSQSRNLKDALQKLREMIEAASYVPKGPSDDTVKKILESIQRENERRLEVKKYRADKKGFRKVT